jgi:hypothetical protein
MKFLQRAVEREIRSLRHWHRLSIACLVWCSALATVSPVCAAGAVAWLLLVIGEARDMERLEAERLSYMRGES